MRAMPWPANYDAGVIQGREDDAGEISLCTSSFDQASTWKSLL
jgi:hypothetical protein